MPPTANTPGAEGYLAAWAIAVLLFAGGIAGTMLAVEEGSGLLEFCAALGVLALYTAILSIPFALPGVVVVHNLCRDIPQQRVHVLGAACVGAMAGGVLTLVAGGLPVLPAALATCTALGRAAVIPLVSKRRRRDSLPSAVRC